MEACNNLRWLKINSGWSFLGKAIGSNRVKIFALTAITSDGNQSRVIVLHWVYLLYHFYCCFASVEEFYGLGSGFIECSWHVHKAYLGLRFQVGCNTIMYLCMYATSLHYSPSSFQCALSFTIMSDESQRYVRVYDICIPSVVYKWFE